MDQWVLGISRDFHLLLHDADHTIHQERKPHRIALGDRGEEEGPEHGRKHLGILVLNQLHEIHAREGEELVYYAFEFNLRKLARDLDIVGENRAAVGVPGLAR